MNIVYYVKPEENHENLPSELMPTSLLTKHEAAVLEEAGFELGEYADEEMRSYLKLRETDRSIKNIGTKKHKTSN